MSQQDNKVFRRHDLEKLRTQQNSKTTANIQNPTKKSKTGKPTHKKPHKKRKRIQKITPEKSKPQPKPQTVKDISLSRLFLIPTNKGNISLTDCML